MALVTRSITDTDVTYTITSIFPQIAINALFSFVIYGGYFRISQDNGSTWSEWNSLTTENLHAITVNMEDTVIVTQFKITLEQSRLLINDTDILLIDSNSSLIIS